MNQDFANSMEDTDFQLLQDFNKKVLKLEELGRTAHKHYTDASGITTDGRSLNIELKYRVMNYDNLAISASTTQGNSYTADTLYIEAHKCGDLLLDYICNKQIPLYINFLSDDTVILYNLTTLKNRPKKVTKKIYSKLYQGFELAEREELKLDDAWIYKKENNKYKLIHKPC